MPRKDQKEIPSEVDEKQDKPLSRREALMRIAGGLGATALAASAVYSCGDPGDNSEPICLNTCEYAYDEECDDGGEGSVYSLCDVGTDCGDCGTRYGGYSSGGYSSGGYSSGGYSSSYSSGYSSSYSSSYSSQYCSGYGSLYYYSYNCYYS